MMEDGFISFERVCIIPVWTSPLLAAKPLEPLLGNTSCDNLIVDHK